MSVDIRVLQIDPKEERVETGAVQFNEDWPGTFIRGDHAFGYANALGSALAFLENANYRDHIQLFELRGLLDLLRSSNVHLQGPDA